MSRVADARVLARSGAGYDALVSAVPYAKFLGVQVMDDAHGLYCHLPFREDLIGNAAIRALHGGVTAAFMENAALLHLLLRLDQERVPKSIDFAIDYLLPGQALDTYAQCQVSRAGVRVAQAQIRCWQKSREVPIAIARAHFLLTG